MRYIKYSVSFLRLWTKAFGFDAKRFSLSVRNISRFFTDFFKYKNALKESSATSREKFPLKFAGVSPFLSDVGDRAGGLGSYFHQDLWAAKKIYESKPGTHIDIGSRLDGFIGHLLVFMEVTVIDIRPMQSKVQGLNFLQGDATSLGIFEDNQVDSLSALHVAEHFGLGRYGDDIDPDACFKFINNLQRVLSVDGRLLFSVPIGVEGLTFNAQRTFHPRTVVELFDQLELISFSAVSKQQGIVKNLDINEAIGREYTVGLYEFVKKYKYNGGTQ